MPTISRNCLPILADLETSLCVMFWSSFGDLFHATPNRATRQWAKSRDQAAAGALYLAALCVGDARRLNTFTLPTEKFGPGVLWGRKHHPVQDLPDKGALWMGDPLAPNPIAKCGHLCKYGRCPANDSCKTPFRFTAQFLWPNVGARPAATRRMPLAARAENSAARAAEWVLGCRARRRRFTAPAPRRRARGFQRKSFWPELSKDSRDSVEQSDPIGTRRNAMAFRFHRRLQIIPSVSLNLLGNTLGASALALWCQGCARHSRAQRHEDHGRSAWAGMSWTSYQVSSVVAPE